MEWLFILVLAGVAAWQGARIGALTARVRELEKRLSARAEAQWTAPTEAPLAEPAPQPAPPEPPPSPLQLDEEPLLLDQPLPPDEQEPLVLDQPIGEDELLLDAPLPEASNDDEPAPPELQPEPVTEPGRLARVLRRPANFRFGQWPVQARLAWITGSGLALGAILLVAFAAQQDWFTPQIQLACALALGAILLGAGEWTRRVSLRTPPGRAPVAALLAGAGAVAFYATIWAAHGLYNLIDYTTAAALLTVCSISLIGLSLLHGQAIGVLAIAAALVAPPLTHEPLWPSLALTLYVTAAGAAGFALAAFRRWGWVALGTLVGVYFWFWASIAVDDIQRALLLLSFASFGAVALALRPPLKDAAPSALSWQRVHALAPTIGIAVSSVFLVWVWAAIAPAEAFRVMGPAIVSASHVALAAYAVRERFATAPALVVSIAALVLGAITYLRAREYFGPLEQWHYGSLLAVALVVVICAISARPHRNWRAATAAAGAIGAALLTALAAATRPGWNAVDVWTPLFAGALLLFAAAWRAGRDAGAPRTERVIDLWAGAAAVLALLGVESAFPAEARAAAHAGTALMFASAFAWRGWRVLRYASLAAAAIAIAHALSPPLTGAALAGQIPIWGALVVLLVAALFLFGAGYFLSAGSIAFGEVLSIAGASTILIGAALLLRRFGAHPSMAYALVVIGAAIFARWRAPGVYMTIVAPLVRGPVAWLARTYRLGPKPTDLVNVTPAARREKRYGRRQRSQ